MRYLPVDRVEQGMILGKDFYGYSGELLLRGGAALTAGLIEKIRELEYPGLYIQDEFSEDIEAQDIISDELRQNAVKAVCRLFIDIESPSITAIQGNMQGLSELLQSIIDEISTSEQVIMNLIDLKVFDLYTYQHSVNVCVLACIIAMSLGLNRNRLHQLGLAALLHDLGKSFIPKEILNKPGRLTPEEFGIIKGHSLLGYEYIRDGFPFPSIIPLSVLQHHERYNGEGYPLGSAGNDIPMYARIIAVADVYDAITSKRPYHDPILPSEAYEHISGNAGQFFDPDIVSIFVKKIAPFPIGMNVRLSDGRMGIVAKNYSDCLTRPVIKLFPESTEEREEAVFLDMRDDPDTLNITIQQVLL